MQLILSSLFLGAVAAMVATAQSAASQQKQQIVAPTEVPPQAQAADEGGAADSDTLRFADEKDVDAALAFMKTSSPKTNADALRIWKKFDGTTKPNFTYEFWARKLIVWLRDSRKLSFESPEKVKRVFELMLNKDVISRDASDLLSEKVWAYLEDKDHLSGMEEKMLASQVVRDPTEKESRKKDKK